MAEYSFTEKELEDGKFANAYMSVDGVEIGDAQIILTDTAYVERIDIADEHQRKGYGTEFLRYLSGRYGDIFLAPDNEDARRLYERLGDDVTSDGDWWAVDQGFGVYRI